jgi:hypothetical protein
MSSQEVTVYETRRGRGCLRLLFILGLVLILVVVAYAMVTLESARIVSVQVSQAASAASSDAEVAALQDQTNLLMTQVAMLAAAQQTGGNESGIQQTIVPTAQPTATPIVPTIQAAAALVNGSMTNNTSFEVENPIFSVTGAPESVDTSQVLHAVGADGYGNVFTNTIGHGSEMMFAEPGTLLVGPEFPQEQIDASGGHIERISPITQQMLGTETFSVNLAEGAFLWITAARMTVELGDVVIQVDGPADHCWSINLRGLFEGDGDRNTTVRLSGYVAGHAQVMWYPRGAYISEGNFEQVTELALTGGRNAGATGCAHMSEIMFDANTGAWATMYRPALEQDWQSVGSNWS